MQKLCQTGNGTGTMGYGILAFGTHFGKGETGFLHLKDGVVAESVLATEACHHLALDNAFEQVFFKSSFRFVEHQCYDCAETAVAVLLAFHLGKEAADVGGGIVAVAETVHCAKGSPQAE